MTTCESLFTSRRSALIHWSVRCVKPIIFDPAPVLVVVSITSLQEVNGNQMQLGHFKYIFVDLFVLTL